MCISDKYLKRNPLFRIRWPLFGNIRSCSTKTPILSIGTHPQLQEAAPSLNVRPRKCLPPVSALPFPAPGLHLMKSLLPFKSHWTTTSSLKPARILHQVQPPFSTNSALSACVSSSLCHSLPSICGCAFTSRFCRLLTLYPWARHRSRPHFPHLRNGISNSVCLRGLLCEYAELKHMK